MISVIIRNRNESETLSAVLAALSQQDTSHEVVLVDNNSTDSSRSIAERHGVRVIPIDQFTYGRALNLGVAAAEGEICVILSAHSLPLGRSFVSECAKPFSNARVAGARCVYAGKSADSLRWLEPEELNASSDFNSKGILASGCVIRRSVWQKVKFDERISAAEDKIWTRDVLNLGYTVVSPIPAFYSYLKTISPIENIEKNYREITEIYRQTGQVVGFLKKPTSTFIRNLLMVPAMAAIGSARIEFRRLQLKVRFPK